MKFSRDVMPLKMTSTMPYLLVRSYSHCKMADGEIFEVDVKLAAVKVGP
jgi:hypothetical protein